MAFKAFLRVKASNNKRFCRGGLKTISEAF